MTDAEIKKAWETMKKELRKELGIEGGFTMSAKQIGNRTATFLVCNNRPYEEEIRLANKDIEKVMAYTSWTEEEKARSRAYNEERIAHYTAEMEKYGTKENELKVTHEAILNSKAFQKFAGNFETVTTEFETRENFLYYIRFSY